MRSETAKKILFETSEKKKQKVRETANKLVLQKQNNNIMNGKAKTDFLEWYWEMYINPLPMTICKKNDLSDFFETVMTIFKNALIIEWLDSIGIHVNINYIEDENGFFYDVLNYKDKDFFITRQEATEKAIETALCIYNEKTNQLNNN